MLVKVQQMLLIKFLWSECWLLVQQMHLIQISLVRMLVNATGAQNSNFFGQVLVMEQQVLKFKFLWSECWYWCNKCSYSNFFGQNAGYVATGASFSTLIGYKAGNADIVVVLGIIILLSERTYLYQIGTQMVLI
jgi:hypothetical protein